MRHQTTRAAVAAMTAAILVAGLALPRVRAGDDGDSFETAEEVQPREEIIIVAGNGKPGEIHAKTVPQILEHIQQLVNQALADRPAGSKARVTLRYAYSNHPARMGLNAYPSTVVPLDAEGRPDGEERVYSVPDYDREPIRIVPWKHGKRDGIEREFRDGRLRVVTPWVDDKIQGDRKTYSPEGRLIGDTRFENGEPNGPSRTYDAEGRLVQEANMKNGVRDGAVRDYWPGTDKIRREVRYANGRLEGWAREYYADGKVKRQVMFVDNEMDGVETQFDGEGKVRLRHYWLNGKQVSQEQYEKARKP